MPPQFRSTGVVFMNAIATAAGGCGVLMAGYLKREVGLNAVFAGISVAFLIAGVVLLVFYRCFMRRDIERAQAYANAESIAARPEVGAKA